MSVTLLLSQLMTSSVSSLTDIVCDAAAQDQSNKLQLNAIKTMITVTIFFAVCWFPNNFYTLTYIKSAHTGLGFSGVTGLDDRSSVRIVSV